MSHDKLVRMCQRILQVLQEETQGVMNDRLAELMKSMPIDFSQLREMASGQTAFDPYLILGLDRSASDEEVKKRYRDHLYHEHPDTAGTPGTEFQFQMVRAAYEMIKNERGWQ